MKMQRLEPGRKRPVRMALLSLIAVGLLASLCTGCAGLGGPRTQVSPQSIGQDVTLKDLEDTIGEYMVHFAGVYASPKAILFVPKKSPYELKLSNDWSTIRLLGDYRNVVRNLETGETPFSIKLQAVVPPKENPGPDDLLAYIYTKTSASLRQGSGPQEYRLGDVRTPSRSRGSAQEAILPGGDRN